ncbi:hypothetical protein [Lentilactobacillus kefiri]|uniref:Uncharacterized protein n=2 Tax=Lentilactobacillus kefiri TaxID=33962 RepID=A0A511DTI6_LENKE|nr:hypothetical protein [Lentilactobacillus kefiri]MDF4143300.1 hypothetical protein [Lactobacillus kefiranofaciens]MCP9368782.1 hypothetical protein [Lentilactobacillus kefiri]MDH5109002.1 hypothetical protein [Lentilactobacillus kefiri]MDM7493703.1 hypothetical protein [Lentilactobacillus kefiri]PAK59665.1 hypothetical protein B9K02_05355 [Lentilactobacillus kefiri]
MSTLLDDTKMIKNVVSAQLAKVFYPFIMIKTEDGQYWQLNLSNKEKHDPLFWESMKLIMRSKIWIPVGRKYHQTLDDGWQVPRQEA